ncbi:MAG: hypothetical protein QGG36_18740, partial [Pirellulaceae bacterium]|nr:hypothetical protein [Pirellulaceae bacterium]
MSAGHRQPTCDLAAPTRATLVRLVGALVGALAVAVSSMCGAVQAQDEAQPKAAGVAVADDLLRDLQPAGLGWRRVFVSSNWLPRVVGGGYTQLKIDEFSEIMRELRSADEPLRGEARVTGARYSARLDGRQLVDGLAELTVAVGRSGRTLRLEPCGLAIREIRCPTDAMWGSDHLGRLTIRNASAGVVEMDWSLRAVSSPHEPLRFQFAAPACPSSDLQLDLPVGMRPRIAGAVAQPVVQVGEQESQRWVIELGGRNEGELFIESGRGDVESAAKVRIASTYNLLRTGLELRCDVALVAESPLQQIVLSAPSTIKLMSASLGESDLTEKIRVEHRGVDQQIRISFAQPIEGAGHSLRLAFFHKPEFNRPWSLPRIRFANDDWWREEKTAIVLADDLQLRSIETEHAQQRSYRDEREGGQSLDVQHLTKDASITLDVAPREPRLRAAIGATIRVDESAMRADVIADIDSELGETFEIPLQVSAGWRVQSLEVEPAAALDRDQFSLRVTKGRLIVPLKNPVSRNASLRMIIGATRNAFAGALPTPTERYHVVRIEPAIEQRRVTRFGAATPLQIQFERDGGLQRIADVDLTEGDRSRIDLFEPGLLFQGELSDAIVSFARDEPVFSAIVESSIDVFDQTTDETYSVTVEPESLTVRRVQVHLSRRSDEGLQWSVSGAENGGVLSAERTDDAPGGEGETWNIELRQSQNQRFTLTAARSFPAAPEFEATLIALPGAANHISSLQVNSRGDAPIRVDGSDVTSIPPPIRETGALSTSRGAFRYAVSDKPKLRIQRLDSQRHRLAAWAWMAVVHSRFNINGVGRHTAVYHLQNAGASHVEVLPPRKASDIHISVDGKPVISDDPWGGVRAPLPVGERFPTLRVEYRTFDEPLMNAATLTAPLPNLNIEVLRQDWRVSPPSGYRPATGDDINWSRRLFGDWQLAPAAWGPLSWFAHPTRPIQQPDGDLERARIVLDNAWRAIDLSEATWSDLFEDWQQLFVEGDESGSPAVLIDFTALDALGLRPNSDLPLDRADPAAALAAARLSVVSLG